MLILWQTRMLRTAKLTVRDEIKNGLAYLPLHLSRRDPADIRESGDGKLEARFGRPISRTAAPAHRQLDRRRPRRQPFVTRDVMLDALEQHSSLVFEHYLTETHLLATRLSPVRRAGGSQRRAAQNFPMRSPDKADSRADEPYRRALIADLFAPCSHRQAVGPSHANICRPVDRMHTPIPMPQEFIADLDMLIARWAARCGISVARPTGLSAPRRGGIRLPSRSAGHAPAQRRPRADCRASCWLSPAAAKQITKTSMRPRAAQCCWPRCSPASHCSAKYMETFCPDSPGENCASCWLRRRSIGALAGRRCLTTSSP